MAVSLLNIFIRESHYPIFSRLCDILPIGDILNLSRTCRQYAGLYEYLIPLQWNIDKRLQRFVHDPIGLRSKMGELDILISGSFAVQFFKRVTWPSSDLDLYVKDGEELMALHAYLLGSEGYTLQYEMDTEDLPYAMHNVVTVRDSERL